MSDNTNEKNIYDNEKSAQNIPEADETPIEEISQEDNIAEIKSISDDKTTKETESNEETQIPKFLEGYETFDEEDFDVSKLEDNVEETQNENDEIENNSKVITFSPKKDYHKNFIERIILKASGVISEIRSAEPKKRAKIISLYSSIAFIIILILTDIIPILPNAYNRFYVGNTYVIGETQGGIYDKMGTNIIYVGNGSIMSFGPDMNCNFKKQAVIGVPKLETSGDNALVHYKNSREAILIANNNEFKKLEISDEITGAAISGSGYYGFVTKEPGYKACVNIFKPTGKSLYKWHTNNPVIDISVSDNGKNMVAASYTYASNAMSGKLIFFDMNRSEPVKEVVTGSNIFSEVKFINDDVIVAFGDMFTAAYTYKGIMKWRVDYSGRTLKSYDITDNGEIAFIFDRYSSELSESTVEIYNSQGRLKGKYESKDNVKYVSANNGRFLLSLDRHTILLNSRADVMKKRKTQKDFRKAVLYDNYNFAFSVSDSVAEILSVNH